MHISCMSSEYSGIPSNASYSTHAEQLEARATVDTLVSYVWEDVERSRNNILIERVIGWYAPNNTKSMK